jgi:hypothetical protein
MKQTLVNNSKVKSFLMLILAASLAFGPGGLKAQPPTPELNASVTGTINDKPLLQVNYSRNGPDAYVLSIRDKQGYVFYEEIIRESSYSKKFLLDIPYPETTDILISISDKKGLERKRLQLNGKSNTVYDVVVVKN